MTNDLCNILLRVAFAAVVCGVVGAPSDNTPAEEQLKALATEVQAGRVGTVEILQIPPSLLTRSAVTPQILDRSWHYRFTIRHLSDPRISITSAVLKTAKCLPGVNSDVRWGVIFYSLADGKRILAIYFDRTGRTGAVDEVWVSFGENFLARLKAALSPSFE